MDDREAKIKKLKEYFTKRDDVVMAFLFGSQAEGRAHSGSDWDVAVYFKPEAEHIEWEEHGREYPEEDHVWSYCSDILATDNVDLIVLNRAPSSIADTAIRGMPLVVKDSHIWLRFMLLITHEAEEYRKFVDEFYTIAERSRSLTKRDQEDLKKTIRFLEEELNRYAHFSTMTESVYEEDIVRRNDVERWIEKIIVSSVDISKIILSSKHTLIPDTYRNSVIRVARRFTMPDDFVEKFERWVKLRNVLAHEYLDIKWLRIKNFIDESKPYMEQYVESAKRFLEENSADAK
jgi:uncharacterized protein YutE (UPF0331/DUF86 family)/predicted nucleotidyltransferase